MKKLFLILCLIGFASCENIGDPIITKKVEYSDDLKDRLNNGFKYHYRISFSYEGKEEFYSNENYQIGDTLKYIKQYIVIDTSKLQTK